MNSVLFVDTHLVLFGKLKLNLALTERPFDFWLQIRSLFALRPHYESAGELLPLIHKMLSSSIRFEISGTLFSTRIIEKRAQKRECSSINISENDKTCHLGHNRTLLAAQRSSTTSKNHNRGSLNISTPGTWNNRGNEVYTKPDGHTVSTSFDSSPRHV